MTENAGAPSTGTENPPADTQGTAPPATPAADSTPPTPQTPPATPDGWGADWRQQYAGSDPKILNRLERFASPKAVIDSFFEADRKISSGELRKPLSENPSAEELAAFRQQNGIPAEVSGYFDNLPDGMVIGDEDKPVYESLFKNLHALNVSPKVVQGIVEWYSGYEEAQMTARSDADAEVRKQTEDDLRLEWGGDYRVNVNLINSMLSKAPKGVNEAILNARAPDGVPLGNKPDVLRWLVGMARELNPVATIVPGSDGRTGAGIEDEIAEIEKFMRTNRAEYTRDEKKQERLRTLYDARDRLKKAS